MSESTVDQNCQINIWNQLGWELDQQMLGAVMARIAHHVPQASIIDVYPQERTPADAPAWKFPGRIEWTVTILYRHASQRFVLGALQRQPGDPVEFHS